MPAPSNRPVQIGLRLYRALARAFPYEFQNAYGDELLQTAEDSIDPIWRHHGVLGLIRLLADIAIRLPIEYLAELRQDLRYAMRVLAASPAFTAVALFSLTLGIGVATSAFSEMNGFILRDVPGVQDPASLVMLRSPVAWPDYQRYRQRTDVFSGTMAYAAPMLFGVSLNGRTERTWGHVVTPSYFPTLGVTSSLGRFFSPADEQPGEAPTVVVSYRFWQNHLGSAPSIIGKTLAINGEPCSIIGVGPQHFAGASPLVYGADLWLPVAQSDRLPIPELSGHALEHHDRAIFFMVGRLLPAVSQTRAEAALDAVARQLERDYNDPDVDRPGRRVQLQPGGKVMPVKREDMPFLVGFFSILGGMILLIASSNVANMMLARATDRCKEIAVRLALGAGRARLIRQLMTESLLVATAAGLLGFLMATCMMRLASQETFAFPIPLTFDFTPDARVFFFTLGLTAFTGLAFGLIPALQATRPDLTAVLKEGGNIRLRRFRRLSLRNVLVLSQVAASLSLLLITGFLVIGHQKMTGGDPGFDPRNLYLISLDPIRDGYSIERSAGVFHKLLDRVQALPSVASASLADSVPMSMIGKPGAQFYVTNPDGTKAFHWGRKYIAGRSFLDTLGIPILRGRGFRQTDESNDSTAVIISEKMARECFKGQDPIGRHQHIRPAVARRRSVTPSDRRAGSVLCARPKVRTNRSRPCPASGVAWRSATPLEEVTRGAECSIVKSWGAMTLILELPDSKEAALKAKAQAQGVSAEQYVRRILDRDLEQQAEPPVDADQQPIWQVITNMVKDVPDEVFDRLPKDGASQVDHYLYGLPKRD